MLAADCIEIADTGDNESTNRDKLRVWTRLQLLAKWNPRKYGDKQQIEHSGNIGGDVLVSKLNAGRERAFKAAKPKA